MKEELQRLAYFVRSYKRLTLIILFFYILGIIAPLFLSPEELRQQIFNIGEIYKGIDPERANGLVSIFAINVRAISVTLLSAILIFPPFVIAFVNGWVLGILVVIASQEGVDVLLRVIVSILPHGIIELLAFFYSILLAVLVAIKLYFPRKVEPKYSRREFFGIVARTYLTFILPFIVVAAFLESFISYYLVLGLFN